MVVFEPEHPVDPLMILRDIEKALEDFKGFKLTAEQREMLAKHLLSKAEIRQPKKEQK